MPSKRDLLMTSLNSQNLLIDGTFQNGNLGQWVSSGVCAVTFPTVADPVPGGGSTVMQVTATGAATPLAQSLLAPIIPPGTGQYITFYAQVRGTPGATPAMGQLAVRLVCRDAGDATITTLFGTPFIPTTDGTWVRIQNNDNIVPPNTAKIIPRFQWVDASITGQSFQVDQVMAVYGNNIFNIGPHPPYSEYGLGAGSGSVSDRLYAREKSIYQTANPGDTVPKSLSDYMKRNGTDLKIIQ